MKQCKIVVIIACCAMLAVPLLLSQGSRNVDWPVYGGSPGSKRYSSLKQINATQNKYLIPNCICRGGALPMLEILPNVVEPKFPSGG